jgi:hypothetical protein
VKTKRTISTYTFLSRDRKGADVVETGNSLAPLRSRLRRRRVAPTLSRRRLEHRHHLTLLGNQVLNRRRDLLGLPKPPGAAVACPSLPIRFIQSHPSQTATGVGFEGIHDPLRPDLRRHHRVYVAAAHVGRQQIPSLVPANLLNRLQNNGPADRIQVVGRLIHSLPLGCGTSYIHIEERASGNIMFAIDGARFTPIQVTSVANKRDQVDHRPSANSTAHSRTRHIGFFRSRTRVRCQARGVESFLSRDREGAVGFLPAATYAPLRSRLSRRLGAPTLRLMAVWP